MKEDELICPVLFSTHSKFYKIIDKNSKFIPKLKLNFPKSQMELEIEEKCIENDFYLDCIEKIKQTDLFLVTNHNNSYHNKLSRRFFIQISVKQFCIKQGVYLFQKETFLSDSYGNKKYSIKESNFIIGIKDNHIKENNYFADIKDKYITNNKDFLVNIGSISVISGQFQISKIHHQITPENIMIINSKVFHSLKYWLNNKKTNIIGNLQYNLKESFEDFSPESNSIKTREEPKISQNSNYYYNNYKNHDCLTPDELSVENSYFCITSKDNCQEFCYSNNFVTKFDHNEPEYHIDSQINHSKFLVESFLFEIKKFIIKVNDFKVIRSNLCNFDINCKMINLNSKLSDPIFSIIDHDNSFVNTNDKCSILEPELHKNNFPNYLSETFVHYYDINESAFFKPFSSFYLQENIKTIEGLNANLYKNSSKFPHCESAYNIFETSEFGFPNNSDLPLLLDEPETKNVGNYQIADSFILENKLNNKYIIISSNFKNSELIKALIPHDQFSNINFENPNLPKSDENHNTLTRCSSYNIKSSNFKIHVSSLSNLFNYEAKISKQNHFYISNNKYKITHNDFYSLNLNDSKVYNNDFCIKLNRNKITKSDFLPTITSESKEINLNNHNVIQNSDDKVIENCCIHKNDFLMDPMKGSCDDKEFIHSPIQNKIHDQKYSSIIIDCTEKIASFLVLFSIKKEEQISDYNFKVSEEPSNDKKITSTKEDSFFIDSKNRDFSEEKAKLEKETKFEEEINMDLINKSNSKTIDIMETKYTKANGLINYSFDNNSLLSEEENYEQESPLENDSFILNEVFLTPELSSIKDESDTKIYEKEEELINKTNRIYENTEFLSSEFHDDIKEKQKQLQYKVKKTSEMLPILEQNSNNEKKDFFIFESFPIFEEEEESVSKLKTTKKDEKKKATHHKHRSKKTEPKVSSHKHRHMKISSTQKKKEKLEKIENSENSDKYKMQLGILKDHQKNKNQTKRKKKVDFSNSVKPKTLKSISEERLKLTKIIGYLNNLSDSRLTSEFNEEMQLSAFGSDDGINPKNIELNKNCPINYKMFYQSLAFPLLLENKHVNGFVEQIYQSFGNKVRISELFSLIDQSFLHEKELSPLNEESILENPLVSGELLMKKGRLKKEKVHCNLFLNHSFEINQNEIIEKCIIYFDESKKILSVKSNSSSKILEFIQENNKTNSNNKTDKNDKSEIPCGLSKWIFGYHKLCEKDIFAEYLSILVNGLEITNQNIVDCITGPDLQLCLYLLNHKNFPLKLSKNIFLIFISQKRLNFLLRTLFLAEVSTTSYELLFQKNTIYSKPLLILFTATAYEWIISLATKIHNSKNTISSSNFLNFILKEIQYMSAESLCILRAILILSVLVYSDNLISFRIFLSFLKSSIMSVFSVKSLPNKEFILSLFSQIYIQSGDIQGKFFETLTKFNARILMKVPPLSKKIEPRLIENTCKNVYEFVQENSADFVTFLDEKTKKSNNEKHPILFSFFHNLRFLLYSKYGINLPIHD